MSSISRKRARQWTVDHVIGLVLTAAAALSVAGVLIAVVR